MTTLLLVWILWISEFKWESSIDIDNQSEDILFIVVLEVLFSGVWVLEVRRLHHCPLGVCVFQYVADENLKV